MKTNNQKNIKNKSWLISIIVISFIIAFSLIAASGSAQYVPNVNPSHPVLYTTAISPIPPADGIFIDSNVGIGAQAQPTYKLYVLTGNDVAIGGVAGVGTGVFGRTGTGKAIWGQTTNPLGYAGYFEGKGYFRDNVGIGATTLGTEKLTVAGNTKISGDLEVVGGVEITDDLSTWASGWQHTFDNAEFISENVDLVRSNGIATYTPTAADPHMYTIFNTPADGSIYDFVGIRYKTSDTAAPYVDVFYSDLPAGNGYPYRVRVSLINDGGWHTEKIKMTNVGPWSTSMIDGIRFDFGGGSSSAYYIDWVIIGNPTDTLAVDGDAKIDGDLEVSGTITKAGEECVTKQEVLSMLNSCKVFEGTLQAGQSCNDICNNPSLWSQGDPAGGTCILAEFDFDDSTVYASTLTRCDFNQPTGTREVECVCCWP